MDQMTVEMIDVEQWNTFCENFIDAFAEEGSGLAEAQWCERSIYMEEEEE